MKGRHWETLEEDSGQGVVRWTDSESKEVREAEMVYAYVVKQPVTTVTVGGSHRLHQSRGKIEGSGTLWGDAGDLWSISVARSAELKLKDGKSLSIALTDRAEGRNRAKFSTGKPSWL